tara:strand:- start:423 stop:614 length:192 start_codon:yes stop_codon:yes gene_type:complete
MKPVKFITGPFNPLVFVDLMNYMTDVGEKNGGAKVRHYMQHRNQPGYTRIRQTKTLIIVEWME